MNQATDTPVTPEADAAGDELVTINSMNAFAALVATWHRSKMEKLQHLLTVPDGTTFEIGDEKLVLETEALKGFKFGVELSIMQLGELPFVVEYEDVPVEPPVEAAAAVTGD